MGPVQRAAVDGQPLPRGVLVADVVVARQHQHRGRRRPLAQDALRLGVLLGCAVVGDVTGDQDDVHRRVHGRHVVQDPASAPRRRRLPPEVRVAQMGDGQHRAMVSRRPVGKRATDRRHPLVPEAPAVLWSG